MAREIFYGGMAENNDQNNGGKPYLKGDEYELREIDKNALNKVTPIPYPDAHSAKIVDIPLDSEKQGFREDAQRAYDIADAAPKPLPIRRGIRWPLIRRAGAAVFIAGTTAVGAHLIKDAHDATSLPAKNPETHGAEVAESGMQSITDANNLLNRNPNNLTPEARPSSNIHPADPEKNR